jgi:hypothetical protein
MEANMAFGLYSSSVPVIGSYNDALEYHNKCADNTWRTGGEDHPFLEQRKRHLGVSMNADEDIQFRLHNTHVVTWHKKGGYTIVPYNSQSTATFASSLIPRGHYVGGNCTLLYVNDRVYPIGYDKVWVSPSGEVQNGGFVFEKTIIDRKGANAVLATTRYAEYCLWYRDMDAMIHGGFARAQFDFTGKYLYAHGEVQKHLADPELWHDLAMSNLGNPVRARKNIYDEHADKCYKFEHFPFIDAAKSRSIGGLKIVRHVPSTAGLPA